MYLTNEENVWFIDRALHMMIAVERSLARQSLHLELKERALIFQTNAAETRYGIAFQNNPAIIADCWREYQNSRENLASFRGDVFERSPLPRQ